MAASSPRTAALQNWAARYRPRRVFCRALHAQLAELGYVEGRNVVIERKSAEGNPERLKDLAADLVRQKVDVIVTAGTPAGFAATAHL